MAMVVTCAACQVEYEPERLDIVAGVWRLCPVCRRDGRGNPGDVRLPAEHPPLTSGGAPLGFIGVLRRTRAGSR